MKRRLPISRHPRPPARAVFPYLKDRAGHEAPIVYLQVWTGNRWLYLQAYVDSGASWTLLHADVAELLGVRLTGRDQESMILGNGSRIPVMVKRIRVRFAGREFTVPVGFTDALATGFNVLGRAGFFERFIMCFNDRARIFTATPSGSAGRAGSV